MGLDMMLYGDKSSYVKSPTDEVDGFPIASLLLDMGYWRKHANLHGFIVDCFADGNDDCREVDVSREKMNELYTILNEIKNNHSKADELLPTQSGFFFGSTIYDKWYYSDILETIKVLQYELDENGLFVDDYIYHASW